MTTVLLTAGAVVYLTTAFLVAVIAHRLAVHQYGPLMALAIAALHGLFWPAVLIYLLLTMEYEGPRS